MEVVSVGPVAGGPDALARELAAVDQRVDGRKLALLYLPVACDHAAYLSAAQRGLQGPVVGATTGGAAFTEHGITREHPVAAVLGGRDFDFEVAVARNVGHDTCGEVAAGVPGLVKAARRGMQRFQTVLILADAFACDGEALLSAIGTAVPPHWKLFGGTAGDDWTFQGTRVFAEGEVLEKAVAMVGLFTATAPSLVAHHGWNAATDGREMIITEIEGNVLRRLDDAPAADVYRAELVRLGLLREGEDLVRVMAKHELGAKTVHGELKIRAPLGVDPDGAVRLASSLPTGTVVRVVTASPDQLVAAARELAHRTLEGFEDSAVRGALVFDCAARLQLLGDRYPEQVAAFSGGRSFPIVGMTCYAEIARFGGSVEGFHNTTAVMAAW